MLLKNIITKLVECCFGYGADGMYNGNPLKKERIENFTLV